VKRAHASEYAADCAAVATQDAEAISAPLRPLIPRDQPQKSAVTENTGFNTDA
jgi:hypothetical protein